MKKRNKSYQNQDSPIEIKKIIREYHEQLYATKSDNLNKCLKRHKITNWLKKTQNNKITLQ